MAGLIAKFKEMWNPSDEYSEQEGEEMVEESYLEDFNAKDEKVVNINRNSKLKVILCSPERFGDEVKDIADNLLKMRTVVLNLESTPKSESRRLVDFLSGIAYAIGGQIKKVSSDTFVVTPRNVSFEGDDFLSECEKQEMCF